METRRTARSVSRALAALAALAIIGTVVRQNQQEAAIRRNGIVTKGIIVGKVSRHRPQRKPGHYVVVRYRPGGDITDRSWDPMPRSYPRHRTQAMSPLPGFEVGIVNGRITEIPPAVQGEYRASLRYLDSTSTGDVVTVKYLSTDPSRFVIVGEGVP
jgi:hypothetical protein